jgi:hypothetical protein
LIEGRRLCRSDLNEGPVANECERNIPVRQWTTDDEMIVAMNQNACHRDIILGDPDALAPA